MKINYHSWLAKESGCTCEEIDVPNAIKTISELMDWLENKDNKYKNIFSKRKVIYASINNEVVEHGTKIENIETISFFSPIAGG